MLIHRSVISSAPKEALRRKEKGLFKFWNVVLILLFQQLVEVIMDEYDCPTSIEIIGETAAKHNAG